MDRGILYIAFGDEYRAEAHESASRVSELGDWPICIITDEDRLPDPDVYDQIELRDPDADWENTEFGEDIKSTYLRESPFEKTLFLDTDTYVIDGSAVDELFELLEQYDIAAAHDTARKGEQGFGDIDRGIPDFEIPSEEFPESFPWLNIGVLAFRQSDELTAFLDDWRARFHEQNEILKGVNDQSSFAEALYDSELRHTVLSPEYNHHVPYPQVNLGPVRIVHGHFANLPEVAEKVNEDISDENPSSLRIVKYQVDKEQGDLIADPTVMDGMANRPE